MIDFDILIVAVFLITTLAVGFSYGKKAKNIKDYALGGSNFSTGMLVATIVATKLGGGSFTNNLSKTYSVGFYYILPSCGFALSLLILAYIFIPRMGEFLGKTSIAEAMGDLYGQKVRVITAVAGTLGAVGSIAIQFKVFGSIVAYFSGFSTFEGIILAASIVTLYSSFGGIKAVTFTDFFQFFTFGLSVPIIGVMVWNNAYYEGLSFANVTQHSTNFSLAEVFDTSKPEFLSMIALFFYFALPGMKPTTFQRVCMSSNISQARNAFAISSVIILMVTIAMQWVPFLLYNIDSSLDPNNLLGYMIERYTFVGFKGVVISGVLALAMSTADSVINSSSVLFANDICKPCNIGNHNGVLISKLFAFTLGIAGIFLAITAKDLLGIILTANSFYMPIVTVPVILAILGFRSTTKSVLIGMAAGGITVLIWKMSGIKADPIAVAMAVNMLFFMGSHYVLKQKGGWVGIKGQKDLEELRKEDDEKYQQKLRRIESTKPGIIAFCKRHSPTNDLHYIYLGVYMIIYAITTMYLTQAELSKATTNYFILIMYQIILVSGVSLMMYPIWPINSKEKKEDLASILWCTIIFFTLVVFSTFFAIVSHFDGLQLSIFTINLLIVSVLIGWRTSVWIILAGFCFGILLHNYYNPLYNLDITVGSPGFIMSYVSLLVGAIMVLFLKPKQEYLEETEAKVSTLEKEVTHLDHELTDLNGQVINLNEQVDDLSGQVDHYSQRSADHEQEIERLGSAAQKILNNVNHELRLPIGNVVNFSDMLHEALQKSDNYSLKELSEEVFKNSTRVSTMILNMLDLATLEVKKVDLQKKTINFGELVENRVRHCRKIYLQGKKIDFELSIQPEVMIAVDPNYIRQMVDNIVINALSYSTEGLIKVNVYKVSRRVELIIEDQGIGIPLNEIYDIFDPFKMGSKTDSRAEGRGVGLTLCKSVAEAHDGKIIAESDGKKGARFTVTLPF